MGRPAKVTAKQWEEIGKRFYAGETAYSIAKDYHNVTEGGIRKRFSAEKNAALSVANQLVSAESELRRLPIRTQLVALDLAAKLRSISEHLGSTAEYGAMTAHRLAGMAHKLTDRIDDTAPMQDQETLQSIAVLTKIANSSAEVGINLLRANKEKIDDMNRNDAPKDTNWTISLVPANGR